MADTVTPFEAFGHQDRILELANRFYDVMEREELELTAVHRQSEPGRIHPETRMRFALFLVGWLGGPPVYMQQFGHPRLRMRHRHVPIDSEMRDAWLRAMTKAMDELEIGGTLREFLDRRFADVAEFLRNVPDQGAGDET